MMKFVRIYNIEKIHDNRFIMRKIIYSKMSVSTSIHIDFVEFSTEDNPNPPKSIHQIIAWILGYINFSIGPFGPNIYANKLMNIHDMHNI